MGKRKVILLFAVVAALGLLVSAGAAVAKGKKKGAIVNCVSTIDPCVGTSGNDIVNADPSNTVVDGLSGNDIVNGAGAGADLFGGKGTDIITGGGGDFLHGADGKTDILTCTGTDLDTIVDADPEDLISGDCV
jgi:Ca2+-binding RTX toxin-like protein